jgi:membrane-associated protease RseP (regulator of RpoE activity)
VKHAASISTGCVLLSLSISATSTGDGAEERRLADLAIDTLIEGQLRVMSIAEPMRIAGAELCAPEVTPVLGMFAVDVDSLEDLWGEKEYFEPLIERAAERFHLDDRPRVLAVAPGLAAARAGIQPGDFVTAVGGRPARLQGDLYVKPDDVQGGVIRLGIDRGGDLIEIDVPAELGCSIPSRFLLGTNVQAFATKFGELTGVYFSGGILRFLPDDDQLAIVVGHEFAHLVRNHAGYQRTSRRYEAEADLLGLYFAARAGHDLSGASELWQRFSSRTPYSSVDFGNFYSHPMGAARSLALATTIEEIAEKQREGAPLTPDEGRFSLDLPKVPEEEFEAHRARMREQSLATFREDQQRVAEVAYRLAVGGAPLCGDHVAPTMGVVIARLEDFAPNKKDQVEAAFGVGEDITIVGLAQGSPAAQAGLQHGDRLLAVDGKRPRNTVRTYDCLRRADPPIELRVGRGSAAFDVTLPVVEACDFGTMVVPSSNTHTSNHRNRKDMLVPTELLRYVADDDELAIALAHQMGHQVVGKFRSIDHELEADEIGIRIASRSGFDVSKAPAFWDRWSADQFWTISAEMGQGFIPHGAMSLRAPVIRRVVAEVEGGPPD